MEKIEKSIKLGESVLTLSTGHVAQQATRSVMASCGETVVLATVTKADLKEDWGYFPLSVDYQEKLYAGGRIKGSRWVKREGRPSDDEILTARLIDRSIRPLFPKDYQKEVQIVATVLSVDLENSPDMVAGLAVSAALSSSSIPWEGPVGMVKVGLSEKGFVINSKESGRADSEMELVVSATKDAIVMVEAGAREIPEEMIIEGVSYAQKETTKLIGFIEDFSEAVGEKKDILETTPADKSIRKKIEEMTKDIFPNLIEGMSNKKLGYSDYDRFKKEITEQYENEEEKKQSGRFFDEVFSDSVKNLIKSGKRPDGRKFDQVRKLECEVGLLPRTHGSALFNRGNTQALTVTTLGASSLEQLIETAEGEESKRYIHHYTMPPFSSGETGRIGFPARREIGHGALAERALLPVIPSEDVFPYTILVVTEILSSNGSTSMAATCGSSLSLMDAGVPIKAPVAGIAMGLVFEDEKKYTILTDITGIEDGNGDMDFKVAGTHKGITALQLDVKTLRLSVGILEDALKEAKKARGIILEAMEASIKEPRGGVSVHAPKIKVLKIDIEKIGEVIGPGGRVIKGIIADTGAQVNVDDDGTVSVSASAEESVNKALEKIKSLVREVQAGEIYEGEVKRIQPFGAFVEVLPGKEGLVHVSDMSDKYIKDPSEIVKMGEAVKVRVKEIDDLGRINLSMILDKKLEEQKTLTRDKRNNFRARQGSYNSRGGSKGPHFPTSRLLDDKKRRFMR